MRFRREPKQGDLQGNDSGVESIIGASSVELPNSSKSHRKMPPTYGSTQGASHDPNLYYQVQDEDGKQLTYFETHPLGNRKERRYRRRHNPKFTKIATGGRDWQVLQRMKSQKSTDEKKDGKK